MGTCDYDCVLGWLFSRNATFGGKQHERCAVLILIEDSLWNRWLPGYVGSVVIFSALFLTLLSCSSLIGKSSLSQRLSLYDHRSEFNAHDNIIKLA